MPYKDLEKRREMARIYTKRWAAHNPEKAYASTKRWRTNNHARFLAICSKWRANHPEQVKEIQKQAEVRRHHIDAAAIQKRKASRKVWREANPEIVKRCIKNAVAKNVEQYRALWRKHAQWRRAYKAKAAGSFTLEQWMSRLEFYGYCCAYCQRELTQKTVTIDHVKALVNGGSNWPANLVPACRSCNSKKQAKRNVFPLWIRHRISGLQKTP